MLRGLKKQFLTSLFTFTLGCVLILLGYTQIPKDILAYNLSYQSTISTVSTLSDINSYSAAYLRFRRTSIVPTETKNFTTDSGPTDDHPTDDHAVDDHAADDHGGGHGEESSLFGSLEEITGKMLMMGILVVVGAVLCLESIFHGLHAFTHETPFNDVITAIEKELMVVGCTAFILKIVINTQSSLSHDFYFALEFADLLVPIFSFANCFISMALILMSLRQCEAWRRSYHLKLEELLDEFVREDGNYFFMKLFAPFSQLVNEMEFRVFHDVFCETYRVQRKAFAFDEYVSLVYEKFSLDIIEMSVWNWGMFIALMLITLGKAGISHVIYCEDDHNTHCTDNRGILTFNIFGAAIFCFYLFMAALSRRYECNFMKSRGLHTIEDYPLFLQKMEDVAQTTVENKRLSEEDLKKALKDSVFSAHNHHHYVAKYLHTFFGGMGYARVKPVKEDEKMDIMLQAAIAQSMKKGMSILPSSGPSENFLRASREINSDSSLLDGLPSPLEKSPTQRKVTGKAEDSNGSTAEAGAPTVDENVKGDNYSHEHALPPSSAQTSTHNDAYKGNECKVDNDLLTNTELGGQQQAGQKENTARSHSAVPHSAKGDIEATARDVFNHYVHDEAALHPAPKPKPNSQLSEGKSNRSMGGRSNLVFGSVATSLETIFTSRHKGNMEDIFWLSSPTLYFTIVKTLPVFLSLYIALWLVHFSATHALGGYKFTSFLPAVLSILCYIYIVKSAAILKAITHVDKDAVLEVLEQTEGSRLLGETIREKLLSKLDLMGDPYTELRQLFWQIDSDRSNRLSRLEFELLMDKLDINFSRRKWKQIYREIDRNYDDQVSFEEFFFFLFPTHDVSLALEKKRMKIIKKRLAAKTMISKENIKQRKNTYMFARPKPSPSVPPSDGSQPDSPI